MGKVMIWASIWWKCLNQKVVRLWMWYESVKKSSEGKRKQQGGKRTNIRSGTGGKLRTLHFQFLSFSTDCRCRESMNFAHDFAIYSISWLGGQSTDHILLLLVYVYCPSSLLIGSCAGCLLHNFLNIHCYALCTLCNSRLTLNHAWSFALQLAYSRAYLISHLIQGRIIRLLWA